MSLLAGLLAGGQEVRCQVAQDLQIEIPAVSPWGGNNSQRAASLKISAREFPEDDARDLLRMSDMAKIPAGQFSTLPGVDKALDLDAKFIARMVHAKLEGLDGSQVSRDEVTQTDTLIARWRASGPGGLKSVAAIDGYEALTFVLECSRVAMTDVPQFFSEVFVWGMGGLLNIRTLEVGIGTIRSTSKSFVRASAAILVPPAPVAKHFRIDMTEEGDTAVICIILGKRLIEGAYPGRLAIVQKRFPPLADVAQQWSTEQVLLELKKYRAMGNRNDTADHFSADAGILLRELMRRGAGDAELFSALYEMPSLYTREIWIRAALERDISQAWRNRRRLLLQILETSLGAGHDCGWMSCGRFVFDAAQDIGWDLQDEALNWVRKAADPLPGLLYLGEVADSEGVLSELTALSFLGQAEDKQVAILYRTAVNRIQSRVSLGKH